MKNILLVPMITISGGVTRESIKTDPHKVRVQIPRAESTHVSAA